MRNAPVPHPAGRHRPGHAGARAAAMALAALLGLAAGPALAAEYPIEEFDVPDGAHPHDVAPAPDGTAWFTGQHQGFLGRLDPATGKVTRVPLGRSSRPHGVLVGPGGDAWVTDGGLNAIVRVDGETEAVERFPLPGERIAYANLNTATFDHGGELWFTGQSGIYGRLEPDSGEMRIYDAPRGYGPYGIQTCPDGTVYYASLAGSYLGRVDPDSGEVTVLEPPTPEQGTRRVWCDSQSRAWTSQWHAGQLARYNPGDGWREWPLPGRRPRPYAIYVDGRDIVWLSDFGSNSVVRFDPAGEDFTVIPIPSRGAAVRQMLGRPGEVWGAESGTDKLFRIRTGGP